MPNWIRDILFDLPVLAAAALAGLIVALLLGLLADGRQLPLRRIVVLALSLALLGSVAGLAGGTSRDGVVGDIIPAALALVGGVSLYLFGVDLSRGMIASCCAAAFAVALAVAYAGGAGLRTSGQNDRDTLALCAERLGDPDLLSNDAAYCRFVSMFGEACVHALASARASDSTAQGHGYGRDALYRDLYNALFTNLRMQSSMIDGISDDIGCRFYHLDRFNPANENGRIGEVVVGQRSAEP